MGLMLKSSCMLYYLDLARQDRTSAFGPSAAARRSVAASPAYPRAEERRRRTSSVAPRIPGVRTGLHERPRYGYSDVWQGFDDSTRVQLAATASQPVKQPKTRPRPSALTDSSSVALIKAPLMPLATPTTLTYVLGGTLLPGPGAASLSALPTLYS